MSYPAAVLLTSVQVFVAHPPLHAHVLRCAGKSLCEMNKIRVEQTGKIIRGKKKKSWFVFQLNPFSNRIYHAAQAAVMEYNIRDGRAGGMTNSTQLKPALPLRAAITTCTVIHLELAIG